MKIIKKIKKIKKINRGRNEMISNSVLFKKSTKLVVFLSLFFILPIFLNGSYNQDDMNVFSNEENQIINSPIIDVVVLSSEELVATLISTT